MNIEEKKAELEEKYGLTLELLTEQDVERAAALCDRCVGVNLYPAEELRRSIHDPRKRFLLLKTETGELAGYSYLCMENVTELAAYLKLDAEQLLPVTRNGKDRILSYRSIGVSESHRGLGLSDWMLGFCFPYARQELKADIVCSVAWRQGENVPIGKGLDRVGGYRHFITLPDFWYDREDLYCPVCKGRCRCAADILFKRLDGGECLP